jgi:hypothetical protein
MQRIEIRGRSVAWPDACACCLAPVTHTVTSTKKKRLFIGIGTISRTITLRVPYCETCQRHALWSPGLGVIGLLFGGALVCIGAAFVGLLLALLIVGTLSSQFSAAFRESTAASVLAGAVFVLCAVAGGGLAIRFYVWPRLRNRPRGPLGTEHSTSREAVTISDFSQDALTIEVQSPTYAALVSRANAGATPVS